MEIVRFLQTADLLQKKSLFLLGPRQTGKSWWIRRQFPDLKVYNLLKVEDYTRLAHSPSLIREELRPEDRYVVIDEIQKLPQLLDEVQLLIEERGTHFLLTGSSARKLRAKGINLLGGRARIRGFHPLSWVELQQNFDLMRALSFGLLPSIYLSEEPREDLLAYAGTYLTEEIASEAATKNVPAFSRFLEIAALHQAKLINYTNISNDAQVPVTTVRAYYQILEDTLLGSQLLPWTKSIKRKAISTAKFYFFDIGVARHLQKRTVLERNSSDFGDAFETYIHHELKTYNDYCHGGLLPMSFWRSKSGMEVDFLLGDEISVEAKSGAHVTDGMLKGLRALAEEKSIKHRFVVSPDTIERRTSDGIRIVPYSVFLSELWSGALL
jgi:predicted AAA+ superfamily ATPase